MKVASEAEVADEVAWTTIPPGRATRKALLQAFEQLRREVSVRVEGNPGMFVGFDRLSLLADGRVPDVPVLVQVTVARRLVGSHCVDLSAVAFEPERQHRTLARGGVVVVGEGHGRTLSLG